MSRKNKDPFLKKFQRALGRHTLIFIRWIISRLPYPIYRMMTRVFIFIAQPLLIKKRKLALKSLRIAFGKEKTEKEIQAIAQACFENFGRGMIDLVYYIDRLHLITTKVHLEGRQYLDDALKKGKGAVIVSAHFGNFILMYFTMVQLGYKTNVIMKRTRDEAFEKYISEFRDANGIKTIYDLPARKCVTACIKALRNNEILFIINDQNYGGDGRVFVDFFGKKAATAAGPVIFSKRTGAPVVPMFIMREEKENFRIVLEPPLELETGENDEQELIRNVQKISDVIERYVRLYPYEWGGWMHKRWKSRTRDEQHEIDRLKDLGIQSHGLYLQE